VLPQMRARRSGRIVSITSIGGKVAVPHLLPYDCAKFAVVGFSEGLRAETLSRGIRVTTVVPGLMRTGSPENALFKGRASAEYAWFSLGDALPLSSMSARRAARRIVTATRQGEAEVTLSIQAKLLRIAHDVAPGMTSNLLGWVNAALPSPDGDGQLHRGMELRSRASPSVLTALMSKAARALNQYGGSQKPSPEHARAAGLNGHSQA
jgi:short-subunit dehydrogenase